MDLVCISTIESRFTHSNSLVSRIWSLYPFFHFCGTDHETIAGAGVDAFDDLDEEETEVSGAGNLVIGAELRGRGSSSKLGEPVRESADAGVGSWMSSQSVEYLDCKVIVSMEMCMECEL